ncbi:cupin domain-containing protein [Aquibaculum arenosum]|uniref:Cupin domain-containing protein n=1 Tax=Aquibaculum arenosum TaxID=3032591 RepID=A0ABT5YQW7_9PROT|nr:cupin domain-containing protein [Fodinicurvata sp. CAU 1616]MDF2097354.1 cupin domain-containing protein [Fodinicurvata sp. CAU 1616]
MSAITPNAPNHQGLSRLKSRHVDVEGLPWEPTRFPGVESKTLLLDPEKGLLTALIRMAPGAALPDHEHVAIEQSNILEGRLVDHDGEAGPGEFIWRPAGSRHDAHAPEGCLLLGIFQIPNRFYDKDGGVTDMLGQDWESRWGAAHRATHG